MVLHNSIITYYLIVINNIYCIGKNYINENIYYISNINISWVSGFLDSVRRFLRSHEVARFCGKWQSSGKPGGIGNVTVFRKYNLSQLINEKIHNRLLSEDKWIKG